MGAAYGRRAQTPCPPKSKASATRGISGRIYREAVVTRLPKPLSRSRVERVAGGILLTSLVVTEILMKIYGDAPCAAGDEVTVSLPGNSELCCMTARHTSSC